MSLLKEIMNGYAQRIRMENSFQLQKTKIVRPPQIKAEIVEVLMNIEEKLIDPRVKAIYDSITITIPGEEKS